MKTRMWSRSMAKIFVLVFALLLSSKMAMPEVAAAETEVATLRGYSLSLSGDITLNFYAELSEGFKAAVETNSATATVGISDSDKEEIAVDTTYLEENAVTVGDDGVSYDCHKFSYSVAAKNMRDDITLTLGYGDSSIAITKSVQDYLDDAKTTTEDEHAGLSLLASKMNDYGVYAQKYFEHNQDDVSEVENSDDINLVNSDTVKGYKMVKGKTVEGISPWGASLILESKITLRLYFERTDSDITKLDVSGVGEISLKKYKDDLYYIDIADICPNDLGITYDIKSGDTTLLKCSALSYAYTVLSSETSKDSLKELVKSLYLYYGGAVNYVTDELPVHCACGKSPSTTDACDVCGGIALTWKPWLELDTLPTTSGNYFLLGGVALEAQQTAKNSANIYLDLNGKTVTGEENKRIYSTNGTDGTAGASLHITDTSDETTGTLKGNGTFSDNGMIVLVAGTGSKLYLYAGNMDASACTGNYGTAVHVSSDFYMYGGTIKGGTATQQGGSVYSKGSFTMKGGTIKGGTASGLGGNICLTSASTFTMNGGTVQNGTSTSNDGGNIYVGGNFTMTDGMITGGSAKNSNTANVYVNGKTFTMSGGEITGHVLVNNPATITLTGTPVISGNDNTNLSLKTGKAISVGDLADGAKIGVTATDAVFATGADDADRKYFTSDAGQYIEWTTDGGLKLKDTYTVMGNNILSSLNYSVEIASGGLGTERYNAFYKAYEKYMPDVFALQEYDVRWHNYMNNIDSCTTNANLKPITELGYTGVTTEEKELSANNTPIYYNTNTLELKESGWVEYEVTKDITNHGFTWAVFQPKGSDEKFIVSSTHIIAHYDDYADDVISGYKKQQIQELVTFMKAKESEYSAPVIMLGDYNVNPTQPMYEGFELGTKLFSARDVAKVVEGSEYQTSNSVGIAPPSTDVDGTKVIDHCMISMTGIAPLKYQTLVEEISDGTYTYTYADHVPQLFTFGLSDANGHEHTYEEQWTSETNNYISHAHSCVCGVTNREKHTWTIQETDDVVAICTDCEMSLTTDVARVGCYCANVGNIENHTCEDKIWKAWTRTDALPVGSGYYYLMSDVQLQTQENIYAGAEIYLDLNGKTVTGAQNSRIYSTNEGNVSLHITDTSEGASGTLKANGIYTGQGMIVWLSGTGSQLHFYAGTMDADGCTATNGVAVAAESGSFTMYGGTIKGGTATNQGGSVYVKASFTMSGGTIQGGTATNQGGNICLTSASTFTMNGGTIKDGTSTNSNGGNIYVGGNFTMTDGVITGGTSTEAGSNSNMFIDQGHESSKVLVLNGTVDGGIEIRNMSVEGVRVGSNTKITRNAKGFGLRFIAENTAGTAGVPTSTPWLSLVDGCTWEQLQNDAIALSQYDGNVNATVIAQVVSGTGITNFYRIVSIADNAYRPTFGENAVTITQWTATTSVPTTTGNYYLAGDISTSTEQALSSVVNIWLDLNGHTITCTKRLYSTTANIASSISITDGSVEKDGSIVGKYQMSSSGGGILLVRAGSTTNIYGGLLDASQVNNTDSGNGGGAIYLAGALNVYGGHIKGGTVKHIGGAVVVYGTMNVYENALIEGGSANYGGCIAVMSGTLSMHGGIVRNGTAKVNGGCLYIKGTFNMNGGTITGGTATTNGGNIFMTGEGKLNYAGTAVLQNIINSKGGATNWSAANGVFVTTGGTTTNTATE